MTPNRKRHAILALSILGWYVSSSLLMSANKVLFDYLDLEIPLLVTFIHFSLTAFILVAVRARWPDVVGKVEISRSDYFRSILPVAICTAGDVGLSNMAYSRLPISIITVLKSSAPVCIYTAAVVAGVERFNYRTSIICIWIATSVAFAIPSDAGDDHGQSSYVVGIFMVVTAVICLSIRWVLVHSLTRRFTPVQLVYLIQPSSALVMLPFAISLECNSNLTESFKSQSLTAASLLIVGSAIAALVLLLLEYKIVHDTSSLTLSIGGIGKEILTLCLSVLLFHESFSLRQIIATSASIIGISLYAILRSREGDGGYSPPPSAEPKPVFPASKLGDEESMKSVDEFGVE